MPVVAGVVIVSPTPFSIREEFAKGAGVRHPRDGRPGPVLHSSAPSDKWKVFARDAFSRRSDLVG
jgi:hypothetical protein